MSNSNNPVPINQQPTNEFIELSKSRLFSLPKSKKSFSLILLKFWLGSFLLFIVISSGSVYLNCYNKVHNIKFFFSLSLPLLLCIKLYLVGIIYSKDYHLKKSNMKNRVGMTDKYG